jgi:hypothetical protein
MINKLCSLLVLLCLSALEPLAAQRNPERVQEKQEELRAATWPPERVYTRATLGYALQRVFRKHFEFCGFAAPIERPDYVPPDITRFVGSRTMRTRVETANISGGGLMNYIFHQNELALPLDGVNYTPTRLLQAGATPFLLDPNGHFDAFLLTKNCSGYLKSSLDAGIEPPYTAFRAALSTDENRKSTVMALSGSFVSPLKTVLERRDQATTEMMFRLWHFYQQFPEYIGKAYYLREFQGVMIKHLGTAEEARRVDAELGININAPLSSELKAQLANGRVNTSSFSGTNWETIVFADFQGTYIKQNLFSPLPSPADIEAYFAGLQPVFQLVRDYPVVAEGLDFQHVVLVEGMTEELCRQPWVIESVGGELFSTNPQLQASWLPPANGAPARGQFVVTGLPNQAVFKVPVAERPTQLNVSYVLRSAQPLGGRYLRFSVAAQLPLSLHPQLQPLPGRFDLRVQDDRQLAFQWQCRAEVTDKENPVDFSQQPVVSGLRIWREDKPEVTLLARVTSIQPDPARASYTIFLETLETWPMHRIDDKQFSKYQYELSLQLPSRRSTARISRQLTGVLSFPEIKPEAPPVVTPAPAPELAPPAEGEGGG